MATDPSVTSPVDPELDSPTRTRPGSRTAGPRVVVLLVGLVVALIGLALVALVAHALGASTAFPPLTPLPYVFLGTVGYLIGLAGWAVIRARSRRPATVLRRVVPVVLVLSFIPDLLVLATHAMPGTSVGAVGALMVMHLVVAAAAIPAYQRALPVS